MKVVLVAAVAENGVIGSDGGMPWHYPEDLRQFKETTMGHPVVMGRRTYESIASRLGGPLPGRTNVVLSRQDSLDLPEGAVHARSIDEALSAAEAALDDDREAVYVVGGATVYEEFLDRADELRITEIPESPDGDTRFPDIGEEWAATDRERAGELTVVTYRRR
ncbi:dihydrofolate reductase [Natronomonas marina]|jgi:dihydrofolate reductase|uniref:dihydrofolate reductase n=1 Tax=Natronomonas marina TaxID=2961939 RepID=UPI0020C97B3B|nr:dihydrofolate reductase [Natronomonas marina]